ncbi:hypothetical protein IAG44_32590 [Streptomyces roseirectus]|uniref:Uncharacterized protein n=1 Tax=Streptomyces roseirectus TaxID=2768066 RepID=A0A7H0ILR6_9ACTN|nr:DUF6461 domain-containing protein [Streptomyces roseirectus]QNP73732.1 hypothetical protein IAG44_32590 [Streptomyces roseirectus]
MDYDWFSERFPALADAYCLTLLRGLTPEGMFRELGVEPGARIVGVDGLLEPSYDTWSERRFLVGAGQLEGWTLLVEYNGRLGITDEVMLPLSRGRVIVSHFLTADALDHFCWYADGVRRLHFEPLFPERRDGPEAERVGGWVREAGFVGESRVGACFELARRITGVRVTPDVFEEGVFLCGFVDVR